MDTEVVLNSASWKLYTYSFVYASEDAMYLDEHAGAKLKELMEAKNLSVRGLAKLLGTNPSIVQRYRAGNVSPRSAFLAKVFEALPEFKEYLESTGVSTDLSQAGLTQTKKRATGVRLEPEWHVLLANPADNDSDALRCLPEASVEVEELPPPARCDVPASELFAMQVSDDSSAPAIPAGSFVYVRRHPRYAPKGVVLAALGTAVVVRRLVRLTSASECELTRLDGTESETISTDWLRGTILCWQTSA